MSHMVPQPTTVFVSLWHHLGGDGDVPQALRDIKLAQGHCSAQPRPRAMFEGRGCTPQEYRDQPSQGGKDIRWLPWAGGPFGLASPRAVSWLIRNDS